MEREGCVADSAGSIQKKKKSTTNLQLVSKHTKRITQVQHMETKLTQDLNCKSQLFFFFYFSNLLYSCSIGLSFSLSHTPTCAITSIQYVTKVKIVMGYINNKFEII